ncbi:hypothetical protein KsCSTR_25640 [Candidatus Kuenenia stuttgartiensis]|uniref:Uncharacterized protein n=1 Tax=Kuenenia stuttgartiensis TaxID=174633 RepID=A0A2C9CLE3_KUEST|nr:hypothetical protein KsCSTR_25640 [Candidatus Kuenenia stuttgartiensis]SOH06491.1 hypothetical protein KSMBR1_4019 [Candidatus Kuenenia stuttgartiensis]
MSDAIMIPQILQYKAFIGGGLIWEERFILMQKSC